jgi:hypothetical protein
LHASPTSDTGAGVAAPLGDAEALLDGALLEAALLFGALLVAAAAGASASCTIWRILS